MKRIAVLLSAVVLSFGGMSVASPAAHACEGVDCFIACVMAAVNNPKDPVCPA
jgi:hypothetical protein